MRKIEREVFYKKYQSNLISIETGSNIEGPKPGQHNWWRGDHVRVYDQGAREQIGLLADVIDCTKALTLWKRA